MGIKGIYGEVGPGERIALSKLAADTYNKEGRLLRIAVDISIWNFQIQAGKGGKNPELRTLYYRLLRLLSLSIQPLFVFDGPDKPPFKRNVRTRAHTSSLSDYRSKQLMKLFGFPTHVAPGEAEAECALLQREGLVDAVLSEDVDTLMFGCSLSMRNWSSDNTRGNCATHVNVYSAQTTKEGKSGLDRHGMILVALMSGGDYIPAGLPNLGIKIACEAARAGFGRDLCHLTNEDSQGLEEWRLRLEHELQTNESGWFRTKHKTLSIPETFPDKAVLSYYTHPSVSSAEEVIRLEQEIQWDVDVDVLGLRRFVSTTFDWHYQSGAKKFLRGLAPALLVQRLLKRGKKASPPSMDISLRETEETMIIKEICGHSNRKDFSTDGIPEIRVTYIPSDIVRLDFQQEEDDSRNVMDESASEVEPQESGNDAKVQPASPTKRRARTSYDPCQPTKLWVLETFVKTGVPSMFTKWEADIRNPKKVVPRKPKQAKQRTKTSKDLMRPGPLYSYMKVAKPGVQKERMTNMTDIEKPIESDVPEFPPVFLTQATIAKATPSSKADIINKTKKALLNPRQSKAQRVRPKSGLTSLAPTLSSSKGMKENPWSLSRRPVDTLGFKISEAKRYSALGIYGSSSQPLNRGSSSPQPADLDDSIEPNFTTGNDQPDFALPQASPSRKKKYTRTPSPPLNTSETTNLENLSHIGRVNNPRSTANEHHHHPALSLTPYESKSYDPQTPQHSHESPKPLPRTPISNRSRSSSASLPSPSFLFSPTRQKSSSHRTPSHLTTTTTPPTPSHQPLSPARHSKKAKELIAVRESLPGAWKDVPSWEVKAGVVRERNVFQEVEVLDLTSE